jgi:hypothetical protein
MFRDGLSLSDIDIQSVSRNGGNDRYSGVVAVGLRDSNQKREIFKKKKDLKKSRNYSKVYIDNGMPLETRIFQGNVMTLLKEKTCAKETLGHIVLWNMELSRMVAQGE